MAGSGPADQHPTGSPSQAAPGKTLPGKRTRLTVFVVASFSVYAFFLFLVGFAGWAWWQYSRGSFTPADTAFLAAEATLLLAAAAILVIVFEIEKAAKARGRSARRTRVPQVKKDK